MLEFGRVLSAELELSESPGREDLPSKLLIRRGFFLRKVNLKKHTAMTFMNMVSSSGMNAPEPCLRVNTQAFIVIQFFPLIPGSTPV